MKPPLLKAKMADYLKLVICVVATWAAYYSIVWLQRTFG